MSLKSPHKRVMKKIEPIVFVLQAAMLAAVILLFSCADNEVLEKPNPNQPPGQPPPVKDTKPPSIAGYKVAYDSVLLIFDEPVKPYRFTVNHNTIYYDTSKLSYSTHWKIRRSPAWITFPRPCLSCENTVYHWVRDKAGNFIQRSFTFYQDFQKIQLGGGVKKYFLDADEKLIYALVQHYSGSGALHLYIISVEQKTIVDIQPLEFVVDYGQNISMTRNPYDGLLYIYSNRHPYIYVYSHTAKHLVKTIEITAEDRTLPYKYPESIAFTKSGIGLIVAKLPYGSDAVLKRIDTSNNDTISHLPDYRQTPIQVIQSSRTEGSIFVAIGYTGYLYPFLIYHPNGQFEEVPFTKSGYAEGMRTHRKNNTILIELGLTLFIKNLDTGQESFPSYPVWHVTYDFSYAPGENNIAWVFEEARGLALLDYGNAVTLLEYEDRFVYFRGVTVTQDNKWLLMHEGRHFYFFNLTDLRRTNLSQP